MATSNTYRPQRLPDPSTHIRLLELEETSTWQGDGMRCRLTVWPLKGAPPYHGISYTVGHPAPVCAVTVSGQHLWIPRNTADVLHLLAYHKKSRFYWIDAICIAQDDISEKNGQVALMGEIYRQAKHVLICLDRADDKTEDSMKMISELETHASVYSAIRALEEWDMTDNIWPLEYPWEPRSPQALQAIDKCLADALAALVEVSKQRFRDFMLGLRDLSVRPYFQRMWVVQELLLASNATVCCGKASMPESIMYTYLRFAFWTSTALNYYRTFESAARGSEHLRAMLQIVSPDLCEQGGWVLSKDPVFLLWHRVMAELEQAKFDALTAINVATYRKCADRRDTVYSMLSLIKWPEKPLEPDYNLPAFWLAVDYCTCGALTPIAVDRLIENLGIDLNDAELQRVVTDRHSHVTCSRQTNTLEYCSAFGIYSGVRLTGRSCHSPTPGIHVVTHTEGCAPTTFLALEFQDQDWLIYEKARPIQGEFRRGFIVHRHTDVFAIVGRAFLLGSWPDESGKGFAVSFDPEDYILSQCIFAGIPDPESVFKDLASMDEWMENLLRTPICREPFSSYAYLPSEE